MHGIPVDTTNDSLLCHKIAHTKENQNQNANKKFNIWIQRYGFSCIHWQAVRKAAGPLWTEHGFHIYYVLMSMEPAKVFTNAIFQP